MDYFFNPFMPSVLLLERQLREVILYPIAYKNLGKWVKTSYLLCKGMYSITEFTELVTERTQSQVDVVKPSFIFLSRFFKTHSINFNYNLSDLPSIAFIFFLLILEYSLFHVIIRKYRKFYSYTSQRIEKLSVPFLEHQAQPLLRLRLIFIYLSLFFNFHHF